jgi:hypothetical protein
MSIIHLHLEESSFRKGTAFRPYVIIENRSGFSC